MTMAQCQYLVVVCLYLVNIGVDGSVVVVTCKQAPPDRATIVHY